MKLLNAGTKSGLCFITADEGCLAAPNASEAVSVLVLSILLSRPDRLFLFRANAGQRRPYGGIVASFRRN